MNAARLAEIEALAPYIVWGATTEQDCYTGCGVTPTDLEDTVDWCLYDTGEDDPPLAKQMMAHHAQYAAAAMNAVPDLASALREARELAKAEHAARKRAERRLGSPTEWLDAAFDAAKETW